MSQINSECLSFDDTDDETEVNSLLSGFLINAALVIQASTPTIQKYQRSHMVRDRYELYGEDYLRRPTQTDVEKLYAFHKNKHGFPSMIGSIDCTKWPWGECPQAYRAQFSRGDSGSEPFILLEAIASQDL
nr:hypothetical protein [Tanacetum cinerariifolium]